MLSIACLIAGFTAICFFMMIGGFIADAIDKMTEVKDAARGKIH